MTHRWVLNFSNVGDYTSNLCKTQCFWHHLPTHHQKILSLPLIAVLFASRPSPFLNFHFFLKRGVKVLDITQSVGYNRLRRSRRMIWRSSRGSYQSGQMGLTVNQLRKLRRFESSTAHLQFLCSACPCGAAVAHILGKNEAMGSIPITGSVVFRGCWSLSF